MLGGCTAPDLAVSLKGAAGPGSHGGAEPGTVWIGLDAGDVTHARGYVATGTGRVCARGRNRPRSTLFAAISRQPLPESDRVV